MDILDYCKKVVRLAEKEGAQQAECFASFFDLTLIKVKKSEIKTSKRVYDGGFAVRCVINNSIGFSYIVGFNKLDECVKNAVAQAKAGKPDPEFKSFTEKHKYTEISGTFDENIKYLDLENVIKNINSASRIDDARVKSVTSYFSASTFNVAIVNSLGVEGYDEGTYLTFHSEVTTKENNNYSSSFDAYASRKLKDFNPQEVVSSAYDFAIKGLNKQKIQSMMLPVLLDPIAVFFIIGASFSLGLNADAVQRKRSFLSNDLNNKISDDKLTVIDDGTLESGIGSFKFDAEGYPSMKNVLIENGILKSYIYDTYTANKENRKSTGNTIRGDMGEFLNFRSTPRIGIRNMIIKEGNKKLYDILSEIKRGIYVRSTFDYPNVVTGEFSGMINEGFYIDNGEIKFALQQAGIGIKLKEALKNIIEISQESRQFINFRLPYIMIDKVNIAGAL